MPLEFGVWRIDEGLESLDVGSLDSENRLENLLDQDISIASPNWMIIGRQVCTDFGKFIDLLALDRDGKLIVIELKREKTPREVVAQLLDYGSWVKELEDEDIAYIFENYLKKYHTEQTDISLDDAFCQKFQVKEMPENLNDLHELVVVAAALDDSTERIISYLANEFGVPINSIFFRVFKDDKYEFLTRAWFIDPSSNDIQPNPNSDEEWNGEYYVSFGHSEHRHWEDAVKYGFISAGCGLWYSKTLKQLEAGARVWVNVPGEGYVGVGEVVDSAVIIDRFFVLDENGKEVPITDVELSAPKMLEYKGSDEKSEYLVRIRWIKTVSLSDAIKETGFFGNQNTVCKPTARKWKHTVDRLKKRFRIP